MRLAKPSALGVGGTLDAAKSALIVVSWRTKSRLDAPADATKV